MLRKASDLLGLKLGAIDGAIGHLKDFYFEDRSWTVRYLVADTGQWLPGRRVLLSPFALQSIDETGHMVHFDLTTKEIEEAPSVDADKPVTRQHEIEYSKHYGWPMYWYGPVLWGPTPYPVYDRSVAAAVAAREVPREQTGNPHLRSINEVRGYHVQATDGEIGHLEDFIFDAQDWAIRYAVVDTRNWWPGKRVLVAPSWIREISWEEAKAHVDLDRTTIRQAPEYDPGSPITRPYETKLFEYYGRQAYWNEYQESQSA